MNLVKEKMNYLFRNGLIFFLNTRGVFFGDEKLYLLLYIFRNFETIIHILKGNIGIGGTGYRYYLFLWYIATLKQYRLLLNIFIFYLVLTLPMAIRNSGLIFGSIGLLLIAYICVYCMTLLVKAAHKVST